MKKIEVLLLSQHCIFVVEVTVVNDDFGSILGYEGGPCSDSLTHSNNIKEPTKQQSIIQSLGNMFDKTISSASDVRRT